MAGTVGPDGAYRHGLSLDVPSFHGLEPQVGISYSSAAGNDLAGWGWSLTGDSTIERTSRGRGVPALDASDVYRLDGNDLIPCASQKLKGPSCLAGGTHSTERETFQRVSLEGSRWQVWDTNGTRSTYVDRSPFSAPDTVWKLAERTNTHGDRIIYQRWCDSGDACYLEEIEYEDSTDPAQRTRIHLRYAPRPDPYTYGVGPLVISVRYRLTAMLVSTAGANRNALALQYEPASAQEPGRYPLRTATRYGNDVVVDAAGTVTAGTAHPPETFGSAFNAGNDPLPPTHLLTDALGPPWTSDGGGSSYGEWSTSTSLPYRVTSDRWMSFDADGDGRSDYVAGQWARNAQGDAVVLLRTALRTGDNTYIYSSQLTPWRFGPLKDTWWRLVPGDYDGDARTDLANIFWDPQSNRVMAEIALSTGHGAFMLMGAQPTGISGWDIHARWMSGDADGDGRADLMSARPLPPDNTVSYWHAGLTVGFTAANGRTGLWRATPTEWGFTLGDAPFWFVGDHNADGRADLLRVMEVWDPNNQFIAGWLATALSNGDGTWTLNKVDTRKKFEGAVMRAGPRWAGTGVGGDMAHAGDFDGNGKTDLMFTTFHVANQQLRLGFTVGLANDTGGFDLVHSTTSLDGRFQNTGRIILSGGASYPNQWMAGDVDGDSLTDLIITSPLDKSEAPTKLQVLTLASKGDGTFTEPADLNSASNIPFTCAWHNGETDAWCGGGVELEALLGDANGDGRMDVMTAGLEGDDLNGTTRLDTVLSPNNGLDGHRWKTTDITGDGLSDQVYVQYTNPGLNVRSSIADPAAPAGRRQVAGPVANAGWFSEADVRQWMAIDVGRPGGGGPDGRADLVHLARATTPGATDKTLSTVLLSHGDGTFAFKQSTAVAPDPEASTRSWVPEDVDGNGTIDLVRASPNGSSGLIVETLIADGDGTWTHVSSPTTVPVPVTAPHRFVSADVNGDGLGDLVQVQASSYAAPGSPTETVLTLLSNGNGTWASRSNTTPAANREPVMTWQPGELNGDGLTDLVRARRTPGGVAFDRLLSAGRGTWEASVGTTHTIGLHGARWRALDANGDGLTDLAMLSTVLNGDTRIYWAINTGTDMFVDSQTAALSDRNVAHWVGGDINNDGTDELVIPRRAGAAVSLVALQGQWRRQLLQGVENGLGLATSINYRSAGGNHSSMPVGQQLSVVKSIRRQSLPATSGSPPVVKYGYDGGRYDFTRGRFLGFGIVTASEGNTATSTSYRQTPGCAGRAEQIELRGLAGPYWQDSVAYADPSTKQQGPWSCLPVEQIREESEQTTKSRTVVTSRMFDSFGNATLVEEKGEFADANRDGVDDVADDNRTRRTSFAPNLTTYVVSLPARSELLSGNGVLVAAVRTIYDGQSSHTISPLKGDATTQSALETSSGRYLDTIRTFDTHGNPRLVTDPAGRWTNTTWDPTFARFPEQTCDASLCRRTAWDLVLGQPARNIDENALVTVHHYDTFGRHRRTTYPDGGCLQHAYLGWGAFLPPFPQRIQESYCVVVGGGNDGVAGTVWREQSLDGLGRVWREERSGGYRRDRRFLAATHLVVSEDGWHDIAATQVTTRYHYDDARRLRDTLRPDGSVATLTYGVGTITQGGAIGQHRTETFDGRGRVRAVIEKDTVGGTTADLHTSYDHDALDQLRSITDAAGRATTWLTNSLGWEHGACDPDRHCRRRTFDDGGLPLTETDHLGQRIDYLYDVSGRRTGKALHDPAGNPTDTLRWDYDVDPATGQPAGWSAGLVTFTEHVSANGTSVEHRQYDNRARPTLIRRCVDKQCIEDRTTWDPAGRIATIEYPDATGVVSPSSETVGHGYDAAGRLSKVTGYVTNIGYTPDDQVDTTTLANGTAEKSTHDPLRATLTGIAVHGPKGMVADTVYSYDTAGRLKGEDRASPLPFQTRPHYDAMNRLEDVVGATPDTFAYDTTGNITARQTTGNYEYTDPQHPHAVTRVSGRELSYDRVGNLISDHNRQEFEWDAEGHLTAATSSAGKVTFAYDADGQRTRKHAKAGDSTYHGRYAEVAANGDIIRSYYAGDRLVARSTLLWDTRYYHPDRLGTPMIITNETGQLIEVLAHDAFGVVTGAYSQVPDDRDFTGGRKDDETGLVLLGDRYYDPTIGRFISPDNVVADIGRPQTLNRYAYTTNNPVNRVDPSGHIDTEAGQHQAPPPPPPPPPASGITIGTSKRSASLVAVPDAVLPPAGTPTPDGAAGQTPSGSTTHYVGWGVGISLDLSFIQPFTSGQGGSLGINLQFLSAGPDRGFKIWKYVPAADPSAGLSVGASLQFNLAWGNGEWSGLFDNYGGGVGRWGGAAFESPGAAETQEGWQGVSIGPGVGPIPLPSFYGTRTNYSEVPIPGVKFRYPGRIF
ncbi:FG-GAP-like repeat-containing protein [Paractinoplanes rishiriensis]|uniref:Insecticide toxin TcdB middle/N-terminal domain-containing protein n=1 Tax=Paractinoplanes rishiriensis TaxID=1050105 RepID=A0A919JWL4_9ACTN|nr:FG-GAP-like repeat-containing protein [Actinoplanes rishiriensis]GIE94647.1 hypothetical protein Ari01nite_21120 [Actinoplanes rishiriensis]